LFIEHEWDGAAESFLLMASRRDHVMNRIKPVLDSGAWVVSDRFSLTTFAYQGYGRGVGLTVLKDMNWLATGGLTPDLSIILDIPSDVGLARARKRSTPDRVERLNVEWFERVRDGFLKLAVRRKATCAVVDATGSPESVHLFVKAVIRDRLEVEL
jgi:dTMP kinase